MTTQMTTVEYLRTQVDWRLMGAAAVAAAVCGLGAIFAGLLLTLAVAAAVLFVACAYRPIFATYSYLLVLPFVAGIDRGNVIPLVRLNEAVLTLLVAGACVGLYLRFVRGDVIRLRVGGLDGPLAFFVLLATVWPIAWLMLRGNVPHLSDLAAVLPVCKLVGLLVLVRATVCTENQLIRCIRLIAWTAAGVAVIAVLQTLGFAPVLALLHAFWPPVSDGLNQRGTTTLGSSIATGDYIIFALTLVICCSWHGILGRRERLCLGFVLGAGVLAAGQFSTWISALVAGVVLLVWFPDLRRKALRFLPIAGVAGIIGAPAFLGRVSQFDGGRALPPSWLGRWYNVTTFYLPSLRDFHYVLGVSPNSVLPAPEVWRNEIYLESGYLQLLWVGGLPLLAAFIWLSVAVLRTTSRLGSRRDAAGAVATTLQAAWWILLVLSVIDIHLVVRGGGDLLFTLLAITSGRAVAPAVRTRAGGLAIDDSSGAERV